MAHRVDELDGTTLIGGPIGLPTLMPNLHLRRSWWPRLLSQTDHDMAVVDAGQQSIDRDPTPVSSRKEDGAGNAVEDDAVVELADNPSPDPDVVPAQLLEQGSVSGVRWCGLSV